MAHVAPRSCICLLAFLAIAVSVGCSSGAEHESSIDSRDATTGSERGDAAQVPEAGSSSPLPATTKGYELYAWDESGALSFTLITGTNRLKTVSELVAADAGVEEGEWVVIHGDGLDALERVLERVPAGTSVILTSLQGLPALSVAGRGEVMRAVADSGH